MKDIWLCFKETTVTVRSGCGKLQKGKYACTGTASPCMCIRFMCCQTPFTQGLCFSFRREPLPPHDFGCAHLACCCCGGSGNQKVECFSIELVAILMFGRTQHVRVNPYELDRFSTSPRIWNFIDCNATIIELRLEFSFFICDDLFLCYWISAFYRIIFVSHWMRRHIFTGRHLVNRLRLHAYYFSNKKNFHATNHGEGCFALQPQFSI